MSVDWPEFQLGDRCVVKSSKRIFAREYVDQGVPFMRSKDVIDKAMGSFAGYDLFISDERFSEIQKTHGSPARGDLLMSSVGNRSGQPYVVQDEGDFHFKDGNILWLSEFENINSDYLAYWLKSEIGQGALISVMIGSAQKALTIESIRNLWVRFPSIEYQNSAANVLLSLDKKIQLNRQTNQTLEHIAQALFKSWFVDFEPTRAKIAAKQVGQDPEWAAMAAISGKTVAELDQLDAAQLAQLKTTAALFPDGLVESELGEVPEGWEVKNINQISKIVAMGPFGSDIKTDTFVSEGIPMINGQQLREMMLEDGENKFITPEHADRLAKSNVFRGDIVITHRGTLGQVSIIPDKSQYERYIVSQSQCYIRSNTDLISPLFLVYYLSSYIGQHELLAYKSQVGVPSIAKPVTNIRKIELVVPKKDIQDRFHSIVSDLQQQMSEGRKQNNFLASVRDTLLPKLLSGELSPTTNEAA